MAEATGLRNNALPYPIYGVPFGITFPLLDADGDPVSPSSPDSEVSKNGDTFADCTNEATEIATSSGICYLLLTGTEMSADVVTVRIQSTGAKPTVMTLYPRKLVSLGTGTVGANAADGTTIQLDSSAVAIDDYYNGCVVVGTIDTVVEARIIGDYVGSTKVCTVAGPAFNTAPDNNDTYVVYQPEGRQVGQATVVGWVATAIPGVDTAGYPKVTIKDGTGTGEIDTTSGGVLVAAIASGAITATSIAADAIGASELAADAATEIATAVWATAARTLTALDEDSTTLDLDATIRAAVGLASANLDTQLAAIDDAVDTEVAAILADTNELQTDWANGGRLDLLIDAIKAKTDNLPSDPADASDIAASFSTVNSTLSTIAGYIDTEVAAIKAKTDNLPASPAATSDIPSAATIADAVWDEALSGHTTAGSGGKALADIDTHTDTEVASILAAVDTEVAAIKAKTDQLTFTTANQVDATTMSMAANALTAAATASDFGTEVATAVWASATRTLSALGFTLSASDLAADTIGASELAADAVTEIVNAVLTTAMTESYNADGAAPTLAQAMFLCMQRLTEFAISGTTVTVKKLDGSTTAYTLTLDDATSPTSTTRAT